LCLFVKGMDRTYFDELEMIDKVSSSEESKLCVTPPTRTVQKKTRQVRLGSRASDFRMGPSELLDEVPLKWFLSPCIENRGLYRPRMTSWDKSRGSISSLTPRYESESYSITSTLVFGFHQGQRWSLLGEARSLNMEALSNSAWNIAV